MTRSEFPRPVQRAAIARAAGHCEACKAPLVKHKFQVDHVTPDGLTGKPTLDNAQVLCTACHLDKTRADVERIARAKRRADLDQGIKPRAARPIVSTPFPSSSRRRAHPMPALPPRSLFGDRG